MEEFAYTSRSASSNLGEAMEALWKTEVQPPLTWARAILERATVEELSALWNGLLFPNVGLALKTVLIAGGRTDEGTIIEAVALPWFDLIREIGRDVAAAYQIPPRIWEEIVAGAYKRAGFEEVTLTPRSGDFGRDVIATKWGLGTFRVIDQVKAFRPDRPVTADDVRALVGTLYMDGASKGFLTTTSTFAPRIKDDPLISQLRPSRLELVDGPALFARLSELAEKKRGDDLDADLSRATARGQGRGNL